jgi:hypothetical protein
MKMDELSKIIELSDLMLKACLRVGDIAVGVMSGEKTMVDLKVAQLEAAISPNYAVGEKRADEIMRDMRREKKAAQRRGDMVTSEACSIIMRKLGPAVMRESLAW